MERTGNDLRPTRGTIPERVGNARSPARKRPETPGARPGARPGSDLGNDPEPDPESGPGNDPGTARSSRK